MSDTIQDNDPAAPPSAFRFRAAYQATAPDRAALREEQLIAVNADIGAAVHTVLAAVPRINAIRDKIEALPVDHDRIDRLDVIARAAGHAQAVYAVASSPPEQLQQVYERAIKERAGLRSDITNLITHELVNADALSGLSNETGYRNVGYDLLSLVEIFRGAGERIQGRTGTLPEDLDEAELLANQLLEMTAQRAGDDKVPPAVVSERVRAFTLLVSSYDEARKAVGFLCWGTDEADKIAPSIYAGRSKKKESSSPKGAVVTEPVVTPEPAVEAEPVPVGAKGGIPFA